MDRILSIALGAVPVIAALVLVAGVLYAVRQWVTNRKEKDFRRQIRARYQQ